MRKGDRTRAAILDRALELASRVGLEGLTIGTLAAEVGLSKSGLFAHFRSKDDLELAILEEAVERFIATVVRPAFAEPHGEPRIRALFERWLDWHDSQPGGCIFVALATELDDRPGPQREYLAAAQTEWLATLETAARHASEAGHLVSDLDPEQLAFELYAALLAHHHCDRLLRDPQARSRALGALDRLLADAR